MRIASLMLFALIALTACDTVKSFYPTLELAKGEIERGWIPPVLPPSTYDLSDRHDLDRSTGEGSFRFNPEEMDQFIVAGAEAIKINPSRNHLRKLQSDGFHFLTYRKEATEWLIAVHPDGRGFYWLEWRDRSL